jgi:hypothetical protein
MDVDAMTLKERKKRLRDGACFICTEPRHFSNVCPKRKTKRSPNDKRLKQAKSSTPNKEKERMNPRDFKTHIREMVIENFDNPEELEDFMDTVEQEGF